MKIAFLFLSFYFLDSQPKTRLNKVQIHTHLVMNTNLENF